jgi:hypothetical protein
MRKDVNKLSGPVKRPGETFYTNDAGFTMYEDDTYLATDQFVIERPATEDDAVVHPDEYAAFITLITPAQVEAAPVPVEPTIVDPIPTPEGTV